MQGGSPRGAGALPHSWRRRPSGVDAGPKRYSVQRKMAVVARLLRGEPLDVVAREANVSAAKLTEWRERALAGAASALKERERDDREDEIARLKSKVGEITMDRAGSVCLDRFPRTISGVLPGLLSLPHWGWTKGGRSPTGGPTPMRRGKFHAAAAIDVGRK